MTNALNEIDRLAARVAKLEAYIRTRLANVAAGRAILDGSGLSADAVTLLANAEVGTWTPTITFATPGNLSVSYSTQYGFYLDFGDVVWINCSLNFTPTHTTASGSFFIQGLPFTPTGTTGYLSPVGHASSLSYPAGKSTVYAAAETGNFIRLFGVGSSSVAAALSTSNFPTGSAQAISFSGMYSK